MTKVPIKILEIWDDVDIDLTGSFDNLVDNDTSIEEIAKASDAIQVRLTLLCRLLIKIAKSDNTDFWTLLDSAFLASAKVLEEKGLYGAWESVEKEIFRVLGEKKRANTPD